MESPFGLEHIPSPALVFDADAIGRNLDRMLELVGGKADLLRPHIKTHKCAEILSQQLALGIRSVKCATLAEAALAAETGVEDVLISYPVIGPNVELLSRLVNRWPGASFSALVDSPQGLKAVSNLDADRPLGVFLDLDVGMHRTGVMIESGALELVQDITKNKSLVFRGVHAYDGHIHAADPVVREDEFSEAVAILHKFLILLERADIEVPLVVSGGTPTFAWHAVLAQSSSRSWQCSPGTPILWDAGYGRKYLDLPFEPAAFLLSRVVSHPGPDLICLDLGHKAISAENPIENRVRFPTMQKAHFVSQSEEHLVLKADESERPAIGTAFLGIPWHVCPSVALHDQAHILRSSAYSGETWQIDARGRVVAV